MERYSPGSLLNHSLNPTSNTTPLEEKTSTSYSANNNIMEELPSGFPPGYRFCPNDGELIVYYLSNRILDLNLPFDKIKDVNLYLTPPDALAAMYEPVEENEWYFFTPRDRKYPNGERPDRGVGKDKNKMGYWKATGADNNVTFQDQLVGFRKSLVYYQIQGNPPKGAKTNWIMHEYRVKEILERKRKRAHPNDMKLDDWVLCRIYNKNDKPTKSSTKSEVENKSRPKSAKTVDDCDTKPESVVKDEKPSQLPHPTASMNEFHDDNNIFFEEDKFLLEREMYCLSSCDFESLPNEEFDEEGLTFLRTVPFPEYTRPPVQ